ncbi:hypothetical protein [Microcystis phage Mwe-JY05]
MHATPDTAVLDRPAHDAVVALITAELDGRYPGRVIAAAEHRIAGLFAALHAVDATRYVAAPALLAGHPCGGWSVNDTWGGASIGWEPDHARAAALAAEQNELNADECAAELTTLLDETTAA